MSTRSIFYFRTRLNQRFGAGFTLIELLVVIAIIGLLSAVVLVSLNDARRRANDTAIKANMATIKIQAEIFYYTTVNATSGLNTYGESYVTASNACPSVPSRFINDATVRSAIDAIKKIAGSSTNDIRCSILGPSASGGAGYAGGPSYAIAARLSNGQYWCIDSKGYVGVKSSNINAAHAVCSYTP